MSIAERLDDAYHLMDLGRPEGALLLALVAIAGASRRRFKKGTKSRKPPRVKKGQKPQIQEMGDGEAFELFFDAEAKRRNLDLRVARPDGTSWSLGKIFYKLLRCELVHEGGLPPQITFPPDRDGRLHIQLDAIEPLAMTLSQAIIFLAVDLAATAAETQVECAAIRAKWEAFAPTGPAAV